MEPRWKDDNRPDSAGYWRPQKQKRTDSELKWLDDKKPDDGGYWSSALGCCAPSRDDDEWNDEKRDSRRSLSNLLRFLRFCCDISFLIQRSLPNGCLAIQYNFVIS